MGEKTKRNKRTTLGGMFQNCSELEFLDISNFDTSNVTTMEFMFNGCHKLKEIKGINKFNTNKVTNMKYMFNLCYSLQSLDLSNFNTSKVTDMAFMFNRCYGLNYLNLKNFTIDCNIDCMLTYIPKDKCNFINDDPNLMFLYNSS